MGFPATIEEKISGARAVHKVDVVARFNQSGIDQLWIVECKAPKKRVTKEKVLTLQSVVLDVGADRGFLFNENGFQAGAVTASIKTNITLTSLEDFSQNSANHRTVLEERALEVRARSLVTRGFSVGKHDDNSWSYKELPGGNLAGILGRVSMIESSLRDVSHQRYLGETISYHTFLKGKQKVTKFSDWSNFKQIATELLDEAEQIIAEYERHNQPE